MQKRKVRVTNLRGFHSAINSAVEDGVKVVFSADDVNRIMKPASLTAREGMRVALIVNVKNAGVDGFFGPLFWD